MKSSFIGNIDIYIRKLEEILGLSFKVFVVTAFVVALLGIYIANLLFGNHSLQVLQKLKKQEIILKSQIETLKEQNAKLHKKYLEWTDAK